MPPTPPLWIKICGLTDEAAVATALQLGVDAIGFVFSPSPRQLQPAQAARLAAAARGRALCIAVTRHPKQPLLDEIVRDFRPDAWQTDIGDLGILRVPRQLPMLPVLRSGSLALESPPRRFLFEGAVSGQGVTSDWTEAARLARRVAAGPGRRPRAGQRGGGGRRGAAVRRRCFKWRRGAAGPEESGAASPPSWRPRATRRCGCLRT